MKKKAFVNSLVDCNLSEKYYKLTHVLVMYLRDLLKFVEST